MAIGVGGNTGRRSRGAPPLSEINVTPFVDVVLVLLIIFMITAHAMESGIEVQVPKTRTVAATTKEMPIVTITKAGEIYLGKNPVRLDDLPAAINSRYPGQNAVYVKGDVETSWDVGVKVMNKLGTAKFGVNVVTQLDEGKR